MHHNLLLTSVVRHYCELSQSTTSIDGVNVAEDVRKSYIKPFTSPLHHFQVTY